MPPSGAFRAFWGKTADMAKVTITLNGRPYDVACEDGQEPQLHRLAEYVDKRLKELVAAVGDVGEARLLAMASILIADEVADAHDKIDALTAASDSTQRDTASATHLMDSLAERIETIAARLEQA